MLEALIWPEAHFEGAQMRVPSPLDPESLLLTTDLVGAHRVWTWCSLSEIQSGLRLA
jgi:hypothetical protein